MKIRAITVFSDVQPADSETALARAATFLHAASYAFQQAGIAVQSRRVATQPFPRMSHSRGPAGIPGLAARLCEEGNSYGVDYISLGPVAAGDDPDYVDAIPDMIRAANGVFASIEIAHSEHGIDLDLLRHSAHVIREVSALTPDGLCGMKLAALANCGPGSPYFPAAYHGGGPARFALALEAADLATRAFQDADSPAVARQRLTEHIDAAAGQLVPIAQQLAEEYGLGFGGLDFSLAPYPGEMTSLAAAMECLGVTAGGAGLVGAAAIVMNAVEAATFPRCGFSGLMLPVLEDSVLSQRFSDGTLGINDLLLYSAVCGTGLDCIPLPGDVPEGVIAAILLDVAALALRLDKPLTARLLPIPGKVAGDPVDFPHNEYVAPSRVIAAPTGLSAGALSSQSAFTVKPRT
jgi:uncharacterized protein